LKQTATIELVQISQPTETRIQNWSDLRREYKDSKATILALRVETEQEGKGRVKRETHKTAAGADVEWANVVRFVNARDVEDVRGYLLAARDAIHHLDDMFKAESPTLDFIATWGAFQLSYGLVMASWIREGDGLHKLQRAFAAGLARRPGAKRKACFVAKLTVSWLDAGRRRKSAENEAAEAIAKLIARGEFPPQFEREWFEGLLAKHTKGNERSRLAPAYTSKQISLDSLRRLAALPRDDIPTIVGLAPGN
jgi:hypothetical protein